LRKLKDRCRENQIYSNLKPNSASSVYKRAEKVKELLLTLKNQSSAVSTAQAQDSEKTANKISLTYNNITTCLQFGDILFVEGDSYICPVDEKIEMKKVIRPFVKK